MIPHLLPHLTPLKRSNRLLILAVGVSLLMTILALSPEIWDKYRVVEDVQNSYWMARFQDPALFTTDYLLGDRLIEVGGSETGFVLYPRSLGWGLLFYVASFVIDYIWFSKWLIFVLMPLGVIYLFKLGQVVGSDLTGLSLSLLFALFILASDQSISLATGLQRGFAVPLLIMFLYYMVSKKYLGAGLMILFSVLFYLPNFPLMVIAYGLSLVKIKHPFKLSLDTTPSKFGSLVGGLLLSALVVGFILAIEFELLSLSTAASALPNQREGAPHTQADLAHSEGYAPMYFAFPFLGRAGILDAGADAINLMVLLVFGYLIYVVVGRQSLQRLPGIFWHLLAASGIMYIVSLYAIFGLSSSALYYPSRYTRTTLFVVALCFVGLNWPEFLQKLPTWFYRNVRLLVFFVISLSLGLIIAFVLFPNRLLLEPLLWLFGLILSDMVAVFGGSVLFWLVRDWSQHKTKPVLLLVIGIITVFTGAVYTRTMGLKYISPSDFERDVYEFVASLPQETIVAGDPDIMGGIVLYSRRSVLFRALQPGMDAPILDFFDAQYAESPQVVLNFCQRYDVSYLVLDRTDFTPDYLAQQDFFYRPYNDKIVEMVAGRSNFVALDWPAVFSSGPHKVVKCDAETILVHN